MSLSFQIPWLFVLFAAVLLIALAFYVYRYTVPPVTTKKRIVLSIFRSLALILLLAAIFEPLFRRSHTAVTKPVIALLADNSLSMTLTDGNGSREKTLRSLLNSDALRSETDEAELALYGFSPSMRRVSGDSLRFAGTTTDIAGALRQLREKAPAALKAVLLLSDGDYNSGESPLYEAEKLGLPVFTVGIGDSLDQKDIVIEKLSTNSVAYLQSSVPLDATVKVSGFENQKLPVRLLDEGRQIGMEYIQLPPGIGNRVGEYTVHFTFTPEKSGIRKYTVSAPAQPGEVTTKNNSKSVLVKVLKNKMRVAVIAAGPGADVSAMMQALRADPNIEATLAVQQPNGDFGNRALSAAIPFSSVDCVVLIGYPSATTTASSVNALLGIVTSRRLPVMFIGGRTLNLRLLRTLTPVLPFQISSERMDEQLVFPNVPAEEADNVLVHVGEDAPFDWNKLPPIYAPLGTFAPKPEAILLSTSKIEGIGINTPLLAAGSIMGEKSVALLGYGLWRWKLLGGASRETENFFDPWISNVIRWLTTLDESQHVRIDPVKENFAQGEPIGFLGQAYNANYRPVDDAEVRVEVTSTSLNQRFEAILRPLENGRYEGELEALPEGEYAFVGTAKSGETQLGKTEGRFSVGEQSIEFLDTKMNKPLMEQIASTSGGRYADAADFSSLMKDLHLRPFMKPEKVSSTSETELWNLPSLLAVIVALFGIEWFLRKRSGML